jgi:gluconolactonase
MPAGEPQAEFRRAQQQQRQQGRADAKAPPAPRRNGGRRGATRGRRGGFSRGHAGLTGAQVGPARRQCPGATPPLRGDAAVSFTHVMPSSSFAVCAVTAAAALALAAAHAQENNDYKLGPDSQFNPAVPHGTVSKQTFVAGTNSVFPGTVRDYWVYVPAQHNPDKAAALMVFQDGGGYVSTNGQWRVPLVFDNLIAAGQMPVTIGVFVNPGVVPSLRGTNALPRFNRSYEYDGLGENYARFLSEELLPEVQARYTLTPDPNLRAIAGASSGAIAAFTAAWERPDLFRRVFSTIGTYVGLRGGNDYPTLVRKSEPRPLKVFLQDGYNDLNIYGGNWWLANQDLFSALTWAGYDVKKEWGTGGHDGKQGGAIFPDAMRWLWADAGAPVPARFPTNSPAAQILIPGEDWQLLGQGYTFPGGLTANAAGEVFFADMPENRVYRVGPDGAVSALRTETSGAQALALTPDGQMLATQPDHRRLVRYTGKDSEAFAATDTGCKDLTVASDGSVYFTDPAGHAVKRLTAKGEVVTLDDGIEFPSGICLTPDQTLLLVSDLVGQFVYSYQIQTDGSLAHRQPYFHLHLPDNPRGSGADGLCVDIQGRLYVATHLGVQFCDQAGRVNGILSRPERDGWVSDVCFGGKNFDELYLTAGNKVWKRKTKAKGALPFQAPVTPPAPRL